MQKEIPKQLEIIKLNEQFRSLENRITQLEEFLTEIKSKNIPFSPTKNKIPETEFEFKLPFQSESSIEFRVGEYGMAWLGNIVLFFGIVFFVGYFQNSGNLLFSILVGFTAVAGIYTCSYFTRISYSLLSKLLAYNGHLLLFYISVRLHFFQENPLIENDILGFSLVLFTLFILLYKAFKAKSQLLAGIVLCMMLVLGGINNFTSVSAGIAAAVAGVCIVLYYKFGWIKLAFIFIFLVYLAHLNWLINNPFISNTFEFIKTPGVGYFCFIATGFIFSIMALIPIKNDVSTNFIITALIWNGISFTVIMALIIITYFESNYVPIFTTITLFCLIYSFILQSRSALKITASMYALYGFLALSVAIYGIFGLQNAYLLFALQSLLVVSMALWFRSKFIVFMNSIMFLIFMVFYLNDPMDSNATNFSFMLVAFISARVINWKKERLIIKTELLRDFYLVLGFIMTLITFYHVSPVSYITASWILAAVILFLLSLLIKNKKYRWLAIATIVASAIRLVIVDMSSINIGYRVLIFMALSIMSITISVLYTKYFMKNKE